MMCKLEKILIFYLVLVFLQTLSSCKNSHQDRIIAVLQEWEQKEIKFPSHSVFTIQARDTVEYFICDQYKVVTYIDSLECLSCKLHLPEWKEFIQMVDSLYPAHVQFLFFFSSKKRSQIRRVLLENRFEHPICIDEKDSINIINNFPKNMNLHTFLLDRNNKVIVIGDPISNLKIKELYLSVFSGESISSKYHERLQTHIQLEQTTVDIGTFDWRQEQIVNFDLLNIGNQNLVINEILTSCGCTMVEYSHEPIQPGEILNLKVRYKAKSPEYFNKTITVHCNAKNTPLKLKIVGNAK